MMLSKEIFEEKISKLTDLLPQKIIEELEEALIGKDIGEDELNKIIEKTIKAYEHVKVDPYEAVGTVAAQSMGEPGTQMSLSGDEKIIIKHGDEIRVREIGKFVDGLMDKFEYKKIGEADLCDLSNKVSISVPSLDQDEKIEWKRVVSCSRHICPKKLLKLITRSGREITATDFHSFVTRNGNKIIPISGNELKVGDRIPVIKKLPVHCISSLEFGNFLGSQTKYVVKKGGFVYSYPFRNPLPEEIELDHLFGWFIGAYLAEGNSTKYYISISNLNEEFLSKVRKFADKYNLTYNEYDNERGFAKGHDIRINSSLLSNFMRNICNSGASKKKLPEFAYGANEEFVCGLLRGYFDGDGSINIQRKVIRISSSSKELIDGIALLLNRLGIFARKIKGKQYGLSISYRYAPLFLKKIGSDIESKKDRLEKLCELNSLDFKSYDIVDMIPNFGNVFHEVADKINFPKRLIYNFTKRQRIGRKTLARYIKKFERIANEKEIDIEKEMDILRQMLNSDVVWDEIKSISYKDAKSAYVYDISVDGLETFATFDGIITHNTMRTFHYAGVAEINVTLGLPRLIEILDVRSKPSAPIMTVWIEKEHADDKEFAEKLALKIERTTMLDIGAISTDLNEMEIIVELDEKSLERRDLSVEDVLKKLEKKFDIVRDGLQLRIRPPERSYKEILDVAEKLNNVTIEGIKDIKRVVVRKEGDEYVLYTEGSALKSIMRVKGVDPHRTKTNSIKEVEEVLGIEAARNTIIAEIVETLGEQGLDVDRRHIMLVADAMTMNGGAKQIGRHGVAGEKKSVLSRAAFELTTTNLLNAAFGGEVDELSGVAENIIVGTPIRIGTGDVELMLKRERMKVE
jgi:DNA-directed RNA polymerase subunit A"